MKARLQERTLHFKQPSGTSRGILREKKSWYLILEENGIFGIGECNPLKGLSFDDRPDYENQLNAVIDKPQVFINELTLLDDWPSIKFGLETALLDLQNGGKRILFANLFSREEVGIPINGLVWMGSKSFMQEQINHLLERGFTCIKMKVGAINFEEEIALLKFIRQQYNEQELVLRVDANGAFTTDEAYEKLGRLSELNLHSIEQPIKQGQIDAMAALCDRTPLPIALDEELIGISSFLKKETLINTINPQYIILKPSLTGGFQSSEEWINLANKNSVGWWITSALESNIGLNAISQWTWELQAKGHQGLGTGSLYTNNIDSPLTIIGEHIHYLQEKKWALDEIC